MLTDEDESDMDVQSSQIQRCSHKKLIQFTVSVYSIGNTAMTFEIIIHVSYSFDNRSNRSRSTLREINIGPPQFLNMTEVHISKHITNRIKVKVKERAAIVFHNNNFFTKNESF